MDKLTPFQVGAILSRLSADHTPGTKEHTALSIGAGTVMGLHMAGNFPTDEEGFIPMPDTIADRLDGIG